MYISLSNGAFMPENVLKLTFSVENIDFTVQKIQVRPNWNFFKPNESSWSADQTLY